MEVRALPAALGWFFRLLGGAFLVWAEQSIVKMILSRAFGAVLFALATTCSDGGGGGSLPTSPTSPAPRACTVTLTGEHSGWWPERNDFDTGRYQPDYDIRFRGTGGEGLTMIWHVVSLWADGELQPAITRSAIRINPGEEGWICYDGTGEISIDPSELDTVHGHPEPPE